MVKVFEVIISCNTKVEADKIGKKLLKERLVACYDILPRTSTHYFWPPGKNKIASGKGCILIAPTIEKHIAMIEYQAEKLHSDKIPFIGFVQFHRVTKEYHNWLIKELK